MATFPSLNYTLAGYSFEVAPDVTYTQFASGNTRQRKLFKNRDDLFNVRMVLTDAELASFESFVTTDINRGADTFTGPYYTSDVEYTGTLQIIDGAYDVSYVAPDVWEISYQMEVKERDLTEEEAIYDLVNFFSGFDTLKSVADALEDAVNNNNL